MFTSRIRQPSKPCGIRGQILGSRSLYLKCCETYMTCADSSNYFIKQSENSTGNRLLAFRWPEALPQKHKLFVADLPIFSKIQTLKFITAASTSTNDAFSWRVQCKWHLLVTSNAGSWSKTYTQQYCATYFYYKYELPKWKPSWSMDK